MEQNRNFKWELYYKTQVLLVIVLISTLAFVIIFLDLSFIIALVIAFTVMVIFGVNYERIYKQHCPICKSTEFSGKQGARRDEILHHCKSCEAKFRNGKLL